MEEIKIERAEKKDWPYIEEKLDKYALDATDADWRNFFVAKLGDKTVGFGRIFDHGDYFEIGSLGVDYYHREKGIGVKILSFLVKEARRMDVTKQIYGVTHRPGFVKKAGFKEITENIPEALEYKRRHKCRKPEIIKIVKIKDSDNK